MANQQIFNNTLIITGSVTASEGFYGDGSDVTGVVSSSYATTSSYAHFAVSSSHEITFEVSSSHALKADQADSVAFEDITDKPTIISGSLQFDDLTSPFTGSFTGSFTGDGSGLTGIEVDSVAFDNITDKPTLISSSLQFNDLTSPFTGSFTGSFAGDGTNLTGVISSSYATTSSYALFTVSSSHALTADIADSVAFDNITDKPTLISSSLQFNDLTSPFTGSFTGSFTGDGSGLTGIVAGDDTEIQFNNNGELGASSNLTYDGTALNIGNKATIGSSHTNNGILSTIAGGHNNTVEGNTYAVFIGGGCDNSIDSTANYSIILGGICNIVGGANTTILGGLSNQATSNYSFIGSGYGNCIGGSLNAHNAIVSGRDNTITASFASSEDVNFIGGGKDNTICESSFSSILGGVNNTVEHDNSFIIGSNLTTTAACTTYINNLTVSEKVGIGETDPDSILHLKGDTPEIKVESTVTSYNTLSSKIGFYGGNDSNLEIASIRATEYSSGGIGGKLSIFATEDANTPTERISIDSSGNIDMTGELRVDGDVDVTGSIIVDAGSNITQALEVTGSLNISGSQNISGNVTISDNLTVNGTTKLNGITVLTSENFDQYEAAESGTVFIIEGQIYIKP